MGPPQVVLASMISQHVRDEIFSFLVEDLNTFINTVDDVFYTSSPSRRQAALDQLTEKQPLSIKLCTKLFANGRYTEVSMRLYRLAKAFGKPKLLIAQSASALPADIRKDFVKAAITSYPGAIVQWRVSPELFGGMRLFLDGTLLDETWNGTLRQLMHSIQQRLYVS